MARVEPTGLTRMELLQEQGASSISGELIGAQCQAAARPRGSGCSWRTSLAWVLVASAAYHLAWTIPALNACVLIYAWGLMRLSEGNSAAKSFRYGFLAGFLVFAPQLAWFWNIFGPSAICLWAVLSFFTGLFVALLRSWRTQFSGRWVWLGAAIFWTGIEFFRSEMYALRFSWFGAASVFSGNAGVLPITVLGVYGMGFTLFLLAAFTESKSVYVKVATLTAVGVLANLNGELNGSVPGRTVKVAGVQLEFPADLEVPNHLDRVLRAYPDAEILVLSEYTFDGPVPKHVREWCRSNNRYLIAGGKEDLVVNGKSTFRNTAFVIGPTGEVVFQQCKSMPIQFFNDGLAAQAQEVWQSPWGGIAILVCYDLSYRKVTDRFVAAGAEAFIVPFMDLEDWGRQQHEQHARIAPLRAREYGVSIFRVGSSGISQHVNRRGSLLARAGFPGNGELLAGELEFRKAKVPPDRWLAPICTGAVCLFMIGMLGRKIRMWAKGVARPV